MEFSGHKSTNYTVIIIVHLTYTVRKLKKTKQKQKKSPTHAHKQNVQHVFFPHPPRAKSNY